MRVLPIRGQALRVDRARGRTAFSVFFMQSRSFLDHQRLMKSQKGRRYLASFAPSIMVYQRQETSSPIIASVEDFC